MPYGSLADAKIVAELAQAQKEPHAWQVYLVRTGGERRTDAQNWFFRRLLRKLAQQNGHSVQYWHDFLVERFLGFEEIETEDGYVRKVLPSTANLTVEEFSDFLTAFQAMATEWRLQL